MAVSMSEARKLCTSAELDLVLMSGTKRIGDLDAKQLQAKIRRARTLRDKWRDQSSRQVRETKTEQPEKLETANARSATKAQLFAETVERFEKRLAKVAPDAKWTSSTRRSTPATPKPARVASHRATRGAIRETLNAKTDALNAEKSQPVAKTTPVKKTAKKSTTSAAGAAKSAKSAKKKAAKTAKSTKAKVPPRKKRPIVTDTTSPLIQEASGPGPASLPVSPRARFQKDPKAQTAAKAARFTRGGATRVQGHIAAQNKRQQARRNSK